MQSLQLGWVDGFEGREVVLMSWSGSVDSENCVASCESSTRQYMVGRALECIGQLY